MPTLKLVSLGCSKNTVDSEVILAHVLPAFWTLLPSDKDKNPDVLLINTCGFIGDAKQESIDMILRSCMLKSTGRIRFLYVMGCLVQRHGAELAKEIPEVDGWFGVKDTAKVVEAIIGERVEIDYRKRYLTTPSHYAYLKISEGCDRHCAFCAIPLIRGKHISRPIEELVSEAKMLAEQGVKELILVAQDVTYYGVDLYGKQRISDLIKELATIEKIHWIRLQYMYPHSFPEDLIELIRTEKKLCKYIDIPLQHISTSVLESMQRLTDKESILQLLNKLKTVLPEAAFRTTLIVGFPTETESCFEELKAFVEEFRFDRLGVFMYSKEEGTPSQDMEDKVSMDDKEQRADEIMSIQEQVSLELNEAKVGTISEVLIDREEGDYYVGRTMFDSPEVDDEVLILKSDKKLGIGQFYNVRFTEAESHDLYGSVE